MNTPAVHAFPISELPADVQQRAALAGFTHRADSGNASAWGRSEADAVARLAVVSARNAELAAAFLGPNPDAELAKLLGPKAGA